VNVIKEARTTVQVQAASQHVLDADAELRSLFHRLNNQLSIILAHAELIESKAVTDAERARATQVVTSVLDAMGTAREIRQHGEGKPLTS
jgi:hypothetical protein